MPRLSRIADYRSSAGLGLCALLGLAVLAIGVWPARADEPQSPPSNQPSILSDRVIDRVPADFAGVPSLIAEDPYVPPLLWPVDPPLGFTGPSGILPREEQESSHFVP